MRTHFLFLLAVLIFISGSSFALDKNIIFLSQKDLADHQCVVSPKEHAISIQAQTLYKSPETYKTILPELVSKSDVSATCGGVGATAYYYEFKSYQEASNARNFIEGLIWGPTGKSASHPERIYQLDNFLVIVSSAQKHLLDKLLFSKVIYSVPPKSQFEKMKARLKCADFSIKTPCGVIEAFLTQVSQPIVYEGGPYMGYAWDIGADGNIKKSFTEVLDLFSRQNGHFGYFSPITASNEDEQKLLNTILEQGAAGQALNIPDNLKGFLDSLKKEKAKPIVVKDGNSFVLSGSNVALLKKVSDGYIFGVFTEHWVGAPTTLILGFVWNKK